MSERVRLVTFRRGQVVYGVDVRRVRKVLRVAPPRPLAAVPPFVAGGITVEDRLEVLVDLATYFGDGEAPGGSDRAVLVSLDGKDFALAADGVGEVAEVPAEGLRPLPPFLGGDRRDALLGVVAVGREQVLVVHLPRLLESTGLDAAVGSAPSPEGGGPDPS